MAFSDPRRPHTAVAPAACDTCNKASRYIEALESAFKQLKEQVLALSAENKALRQQLRQAPCDSSRLSITKVRTVASIKPVSPPSPDPAARTCRNCLAIFDSRTALFEHVYANCCQPLRQLSRPATPSSPSPAAPLWRTASSWRDCREGTTTPSSGPAEHPGRDPSPGAGSPGRAPSLGKQVQSNSIKPQESRFPAPSAKPANSIEPPARPPAQPTDRTPSPDIAFAQSIPRARSRTTSRMRGQPRSQPSPCACRTCGTAFQSKNQLFEHLRARGHARPDHPDKEHTSTAWKSLLLSSASKMGGGKISLDLSRVFALLASLAQSG